MQRIKLDEDIKPLSEFRAQTAVCIQQVQNTRRPMVITQHGKSAAVLIGVAEYEALSERLELLEDIAHGESMIDGGKGVDHDQARKMVLQPLSK